MILCTFCVLIVHKRKSQKSSHRFTMIIQGARQVLALQYQSCTERCMFVKGFHPNDSVCDNTCSKILQLKNIQNSHGERRGCLDHPPKGCRVLLTTFLPSGQGPILFTSLTPADQFVKWCQHSTSSYNNRENDKDRKRKTSHTLTKTIAGNFHHATILLLS